MKKFRVGYFVEVEVEAVDGVDAIHRADAALGFWERGAPFRVTGTAMAQTVEAEVRHVEQLYSYPHQ